MGTAIIKHELRTRSTKSASDRNSNSNNSIGNSNRESSAKKANSDVRGGDGDDARSHAAASVTSCATTYDHFLDDSLSEQAALGGSRFGGATVNTRKPMLPSAPSVKVESTQLDSLN